METMFYLLFYAVFLVNGSLQQECKPFSWRHRCVQEKDTDKCISKVYCSDNLNYIGWDDNNFDNYQSSCDLFYWNRYFGETIYTLKNFGDDIILQNNDERNIITALDLSCNAYEDTPKIASMEHLKSLNFSRNSLTEAKLYNPYELPQLVNLDLSHNVIYTISVDYNEHIFRKLKIINLSHNYLVDIPDGIFQWNTELEHLDLSNNFIDRISISTFEGIKNLIYLNMNHNRLNNLDSSLFRFSKLIEFYLSENKIQDIKVTDFEKLINLQILDLSSNLIIKVDENAFSNTHSIKTLNLRNNLLENVKKDTFTNISALKYVDLANNRFKSLPKDLFKDKSISKFCITENKLEGSLVKGTFEGLKLITELDLSNQQLISVEDYAFYGLEQLSVLLLNNNVLRTVSKKAFSMLRSLDTLDLSNNQLMNIDFDKDELINLKSLLLKHNLLIQVKNEFFSGLNSLQFLDLSNNNISMLETNSFHTLKDLMNFQIANNPISGALEENTFNGLNSLPSLDVSGTLLTIIKSGSLKGMTQLKELNASHCNISEVQHNTFLHTGLIETIDLSFNELTSFDINTTELTGLQKLILNNNSFTTISSTFFKGLPRLTNIIMSNNKILTIHDQGFQDQTDLRYLDLSYNSNLKLNISLIARAQNLVSVLLSGIRTNITFKSTKELSLSRLEMSHCDISNVSSIGLQKLSYLDYLVLNNNNIMKIESIAFKGVKNLRELDLSYNKISFIQPGAFKENTLLHFLNISHNMLTAVSYGIFRGLLYLDTVDMSYNVISDLQKERFFEVRSLATLIADHNKISNVNIDDFFGTNLKKLSIGDNPIPCHTLVNLKNADKNFVVTAIKLDESSDDENIDGVTCNVDRSSARSTRPIKDTNSRNENIMNDIKDILLNISSNKLTGRSDVSVGTNEDQFLKNLIDKIDEMDSNLNSTLIQGNYNNSILLEKIFTAFTQGSKNTNTLLEKVVQVLVTSKKVDPIPLPPLPKDNFTADNLIPYINKMKQDLENALAVERQNIYEEIDKKISNKLFVTNPPEVTAKITSKALPEAYSSDSTSDSKSLTFIVVCVGLMLILMVGFILYNFYNSGMFVPNRRTSSTRHLPDAMDNSTL